MALCEVCSASNFEDLSEVFLKIFDTRKSVASFLKAVIEMEVNATGKSFLHRRIGAAADFSSLAQTTNLPCSAGTASRPRS